MSGAQLAARQKIAAFAHQHTFSISRAIATRNGCIEHIAPCTPLQEGMISQSLSNHKPLYFSAFFYDLPADMDFLRLKRCWTKVMDKCEILRTLFVPTADGYAQVALKDMRLPWEEVRVSDGVPSENQLFQDWHRENKSTLRTPFKLILIQDDTMYKLGVFHHHAVFDDWSHGLMLDRVFKEYRGVSDINHGPSFQAVLPDGPLCDVEGSLEYWMQHLAGSCRQRLPNLAENGTTSSVVTLDIHDKRLELRRRELGTTHQAIIQACWTFALLNTFGFCPDLGIVVSGRSFEVEGVEDVIGPLFNTIPFCSKIEASDTWAGLVHRFHEFNTSALPYQHTPLRNIIKRSGKNRIFDTLFSFQREMPIFVSDSQELICSKQKGAPHEVSNSVDSQCLSDPSSIHSRLNRYIKSMVA